MVLAAISTQAQTPIPSGAVGWWQAEGNARDTISGSNGVIYTGTTFVAGKVGQCFSFNGSSGCVMNNNTPPLTNVQNSFTMEFWAYPQAGFTILPEGGGLGNYGQSFAIFPDWGGSGGKAGAGVCVGTNGISVLEHAAYYLPSVLSYTNAIYGWVHVAVVYSNKQPTLYLNGVNVRTGITSTMTTVYPSKNLGSSYDSAGGFSFQNYGPYKGLLDEVTLYNRSLSQSEIQAIYNAGSAGKTPGVPLPRQAMATAVLGGSFVVGVNVTDGGYGYTNVPQVRFIGGGGSGAQAVAVVSNGVVTAVNVLNAGFGYTNAPQVVIDPPLIFNPVLAITPMSFLSFSNLTMAGGYQLQRKTGWYWTNQLASFTATNDVYTRMVAGVVGSSDYRLALSPAPAQAFATAQVVNGFVVGATVTAGGSGYVTSPTVAIKGGHGTNATAISHISGGVVTGISITGAGINYDNSVTVQIAAPPAAAVSPAVQPVMRVDASRLAAYANYQVQFKAAVDEAWSDCGPLIPTDTTNSQYLFITNNVGFFRLVYQP